jgi:hypothetical protein
VFSTACCEPIHPDTVSSVMTTLIQIAATSSESRYLTLGYTI